MWWLKEPRMSSTDAPHTSEGYLLPFRKNNMKSNRLKRKGKKKRWLNRATCTTIIHYYPPTPKIQRLLSTDTKMDPLFTSHLLGWAKSGPQHTVQLHSMIIISGLAWWTIPHHHPWSMIHDHHHPASSAMIHHPHGPSSINHSGFFPPGAYPGKHIVFFRR